VDVVVDEETRRDAPEPNDMDAPEGKC
jgi:hypothetical protein